MPKKIIVLFSSYQPSDLTSSAGGSCLLLAFPKKKLHEIKL